MTITATMPIASAAATTGSPRTPIKPAIPPPRPSIVKVRTPATRLPAFCSLSFQPRSMPIRRPHTSATPMASAWWVQSGEAIGMPAEMVGHEGRNEIITVVVARLPAQGQRDAGVGAGALEELWLELLLQEGIGVADVDQQLGQARAVLDQRDGVV